MQKFSSILGRGSVKAMPFIAASAMIVMTGHPVHADGMFPDVPENHWAYAAVKDLADKGIVNGYPNGQFLGNRTLTRYEFAAVIDRMLLTISQMNKPADTTPAPAPEPQVTQDDLNKIQVLVDQFSTELTAMQTDVKQAQDEIDALRQDVVDTKAIANKALDEANNSYGVGKNRKFQISGYVQARFTSTGENNSVRFPQGKAASNSPYNGNYAEGGAADNFALRRSRLKVSGQITPNTKYAIQIDASGGVAAASGTAVTVREGNVTYTTGDGGAKNLAFEAGLFANPFGYILSASSADILTPERPLAFNEGSAGLFTNQDYDRGAMLMLPFGKFKLTAAALGGGGLTSNEVYDTPDGVYRIAYNSGPTGLNLGASFYDGHVPVPATTPIPSVGKKDLTGLDAQFNTNAGIFVNGEYVNGRFESLNILSSAAPTVLSGAKFAPGNDVNGYYVMGGYTADQFGAHPLTFLVSYDEFDRDVALSGAGTDKNIGYGILYNLDKATRVRFYYTQPDSVAYLGATEPKRVGLFSSELQVKF